MAPGEGRPEHSVAMWGAPTSGKTTFLAALNIALTRQVEDWKVIGADEASTDKLVSLTTSLARDRKFPKATAGIERYRWILIGRASRAVPRRWFGATQRQESVKIGLDLVDASGELSAPDRPSRGVRGDLINNLERSRGIVFLFDPIREFNKGGRVRLHGRRAGPTGSANGGLARVLRRIPAALPRGLCHEVRRDPRVQDRGEAGPTGVRVQRSVWFPAGG